MTPEGKVKAKVKKILDLHDCYYFMPVTGGYGNSGVPDIVACHEGRFIGIECKTEGKNPTALQYKNLKEIVEHGGEAFVINETNINQLEEYFNERSEQGRLVR
jgi:hypothetical protein